MGEVIDFRTRGRSNVPITWPEFCTAVEDEDTVRAAAIAYKAAAGITNRTVAVPWIQMFRSEDEAECGSLHTITGTSDRVESHENFPRTLQEAGLSRQTAIDLAASSVVGAVAFNRDNLYGRPDRKRAVIEEARKHPFELGRPQAWSDDAFVPIEGEPVQSIHTLTHRAAACIALEATGQKPLVIEEESLPLHIAALTDPLKPGELRRIVAIAQSVF